MLAGGPVFPLFLAALIAGVAYRGFSAHGLRSALFGLLLVLMGGATAFVVEVLAGLCLGATLAGFGVGLLCGDGPASQTRGLQEIQ